MQIYLETADPGELLEAQAWRVVDGVLTDPASLSRSGADPGEVLQALLERTDGPVAVEVTSNDTAAIVEEARQLASMHERVLVRIPCVPAGVPAIAALADERIPVDASLCLSVPQALLAAKVGARFLSVPVGAMDAAGGDGLSLISAILTMLDQYELKASVIASALEHPAHVAEVSRMGVEAGAVSLSLLRKLAEHPLTESLRAERLRIWRRSQN